MRITKHKMNTDGIGGIRRKLGLSQVELAEILQITRSALVMNERRERSLAGPALLKVATLEIKLATSAAFMNTIHTPHRAEHLLTPEVRKEAVALLERQSKCSNQARKLVAKLAIVTETYKRTRHWLYVIEQSLHEERFTLDDEARWWKAQRAVALSKLSTCNAPVQKLLQCDIDLLVGEAALNNKAYRELTSY